MRAVAIICVVALLAAVAVWWLFTGVTSRTYTAYFGSAVGVYEGSEVRVLGVKVGSIDSVEPTGTQVKVMFSVDRGVKVPQDARAVVIAPSVVSDRFVQLTPAYTNGQQLADGAVIPRERTAVPVELDELYDSLNTVSTSLGPNGANKNGALSDLLTTLSANLDGNGQKLHDTITQLGGAAQTLSGSKDDLFNTVGNLARFTTALADSDAQVRDFNHRLADVSGFLAGQRVNLGQAVAQLSTALNAVQVFINDNRSLVKSNVDKLAAITQVLVKERAALAEVLDTAPLALSNVVNSYNASSGTLDTRANLNELSKPPLVMVCDLVKGLTPAQVPEQLRSACGSIAQLVQGVVPLPTVADALVALQQGKLPLPQQAYGGAR
jgi:virulence factor Mce-like protein